VDVGWLASNNGFLIECNSVKLVDRDTQGHTTASSITKEKKGNKTAYSMTKGHISTCPFDASLLACMANAQGVY
jgi:hypothetical protein